MDLAGNWWNMTRQRLLRPFNKNHDVVHRMNIRHHVLETAPFFSFRKRKHLSEMDMWIKSHFDMIRSIYNMRCDACWEASRPENLWVELCLNYHPAPAFCWIYKDVQTHRIHGTGVFTYMNGWFWCPLDREFVWSPMLGVNFILHIPYMDLTSEKLSYPFISHLEKKDNHRLNIKKCAMGYVSSQQ